MIYHTAKHNLSYNSMDYENKLLHELFRDSSVASKIACGHTKEDRIVKITSLSRNCYPGSPSPKTPTSTFPYDPKTYYLGLHHLKWILREGFHILLLRSANPQNLLTKPPSITFSKPPTSANSLLIPVSSPTSSQFCNRSQCKTCSIHHPVNLFTSSCTKITYPVTTHADCNSTNLIYQFQCNECKAFYIGETCHSVCDCINGHCFTTTVSNPDLPVAIHIKSHQIPFQGCWSVQIIYKLPDSKPDHTCRRFKMAYQLVHQSQHAPGLNIH